MAILVRWLPYRVTTILRSFSRATRVSKIQAKVSSCKVVDYNEKRGGFGGRGRPSKCDERTEEMSIYHFTR